MYNICYNDFLILQEIILILHICLSCLFDLKEIILIKVVSNVGNELQIKKICVNDNYFCDSVVSNVNPKKNSN